MKLVPEARVELALLSETVFETAASAIPPLGQAGILYSINKYEQAGIFPPLPSSHETAKGRPMAFDYGTTEDLLREADDFIEREWETIVSELAQLIAIDSSQGDPDFANNALDTMLGIAAGYGFETGDTDGYMGYADLPGEGDKQLGIISHLDVVPAASGWNFQPFQLTRKDGYLIGRGTSDDKGPLLCGFHALRFWKERNEAAGVTFPHSVRMLFGTAEETGMQDVDTYLAQNKAPDFLFTPDAEFPVGYGEKGQLVIWLKSDIMTNRSILEFDGGTATNGVPASATALLKYDGPLPEEAPGITMEAFESYCSEKRCYFGQPLLLVKAEGVAAHAAMPEGGVNAIGKLTRFLIERNLVTEEERQWFSLILPLLETTDGSPLHIACADEDFGALTCVAGVAKFEQGIFSQSIDIRYPTCTDADTLFRAASMLVANVSGSATEDGSNPPFLVDPKSPAITQLLDAYVQASGFTGEPFTMGGGTYARHFPKAASFGPLDEEHFVKPAWAGNMHGPDEGVSEEELKQALRVYILAIGNLMKTDL